MTHKQKVTPQTDNAMSDEEITGITFTNIPESMYPNLPTDVPRVLIIGATGNTGRQLISKLLLHYDGKYKVRVLVRDIEKAKLIIGKDDSKYIEFVEGNVTSLETIPTDAIHDVKYVIFVAGSSPSQARFTSNTPYHVDYLGVRNIIEVIKKNGIDIKCLVLVSSIAATRPWNIFSILLNIISNFVLKYKIMAENELRASGLPYLIIRTGGLTDEPGNKKTVRVVQNDELQVYDTIPRADLANFILQAISYKNLPNKSTVMVASDRFGKFTKYEVILPKIKGEDYKSIKDLPNPDHSTPIYLLSAISAAAAFGLYYWWKNRK